MSRVKARIPRCSNDHALRPGNIRIEKSKDTLDGFRIRCKTCIRERYNNRYQCDDAFRTRELAYRRWYRRGDPEGRSWPEVKTAMGLDSSNAS